MSAPFNYQRSQATATRLLTKFGKRTPVFLVEPGAKTGPSYDPVVGARILHACTAVIFNYSKHDIGNEERIKATDKRAYLAFISLTNQPDENWLMNFKAAGEPAARDYRIIQIDPLEPGDITVLWDVQCRAK